MIHFKIGIASLSDYPGPDLEDFLPYNWFYYLVKIEWKVIVMK